MLVKRESNIKGKKKGRSQKATELKLPGEQVQQLFKLII